MVQAVFLCRAREAAGLDMQIELYPYWAEQALMLGNSVINQVERERMETDGDGTASSDFQVKGKGDSGAFSAIYEFMQERNIKPKRD